MPGKGANQRKPTGAGAWSSPYLQGAARRGLRRGAPASGGAGTEAERMGEENGDAGSRRQMGFCGDDPVGRRSLGASH
jgi:hypothetical protein